jgi:hypothetical protein
VRLVQDEREDCRHRAKQQRPLTPTTRRPTVRGGRCYCGQAMVAAPEWIGPCCAGAPPSCPSDSSQGHCRSSICSSGMKMSAVRAGPRRRSRRCWTRSGPSRWSNAPRLAARSRSNAAEPPLRKWHGYGPGGGSTSRGAASAPRSSLMCAGQRHVGVEIAALHEGIDEP